jgi:ankyrin repeat protein
MLLEAGADIYTQDVRGATALKIAAGKGSVELVQLIQDAGARRAGKRRHQALPNVDTIKS